MGCLTMHTNFDNPSSFSLLLQMSFLGSLQPFDEIVELLNTYLGQCFSSKRLTGAEYLM
jgi:hypothetical protein